MCSTPNPTRRGDRGARFTSFSICQDNITSFFVQGGTAEVWWITGEVLKKKEEREKERKKKKKNKAKKSKEIIIME